MNRQITPIETNYKGYKFRSRTEARWAIFFDALGHKWEYEKEGYILPDGTRYLPDFFFPDFNSFAEVKGTFFTMEEEIKCKLLSENGSQVILLEGPPDQRSYKIYLDGERVSNGIFTAKGSKYSPIFYGYDFDDWLDETIQAVHKSRSARFEKFSK